MLKRRGGGDSKQETDGSFRKYMGSFFKVFFSHNNEAPSKSGRPIINPIHIRFHFKWLNSVGSAKPFWVALYLLQTVNYAYCAEFRPNKTWRFLKVTNSEADSEILHWRRTSICTGLCSRSCRTTRNESQHFYKSIWNALWKGFDWRQQWLRSRKAKVSWSDHALLHTIILFHL